MSEGMKVKAEAAHSLYLFTIYADRHKQEFANQIGEPRAKVDPRQPLEQMFERCLDRLSEEDVSALNAILLLTGRAP
jgi:hypothetical protein